MQDYVATYEKLGIFYLGKRFDQAEGKVQDDLILYDSKDLVTHAVCVGMTGSGKTGLCLTILEEAAIDGIPALVIDPKGDLANLLLTFPQLTAETFRPWINEDEARKKGMDPGAFAKQQAELWRKGLAAWHQPEDRSKRLHEAADLAVYTPGSSAGLPISILHSFDPPDEATMEDDEAFRERVAGTASSLLGLLNVDADPLQSKEHILLSTLLARAWREGKPLDLASLIHLIQNPGIPRIGVLDLESFYPEKERFSLAMRLNNLLAAPGFEAWLEGEPLDIDKLLHGPDGKPRISIFSIAHLNDVERMFFVSLLLNQTLSWARSQPGTTSLRALLYMDEIFGFFPPTANPPSKRPLLTLMKQARAYGLGVMLATQNPVDLDYKGLANAGTWFIGRLQTERDKQRVLDGLEGAAASQSAKFDKRGMERLLAGLGNRVFLMNNVHNDEPVLFQVRWALSYLRGPLTRQQIRKLMQDQKAEPTPSSDGNAATEAAVPVARVAPPSATVGSCAQATPNQPILPPDIAQFFLPIRTDAPAEASLLYRPLLLGAGTIHYADARTGVDEDHPFCFVTPITDQAVAVNWDQAEDAGLAADDLQKRPSGAGLFEPFAAPASKVRNYDAWKRGLADWLYRTQKLELFRSSRFKMVSQPGECERDFRIRLQQVVREEKDQIKEKLTQKHAPKLLALEERIRKSQQMAERKAEQSRTSKIGSVLSMGQSVFGAIFSRRRVSATTINKAGTAINKAGKAWKDSGEVGRAQENIEALREQLAELEQRCEQELNAELEGLDAAARELDTVAIKPKKTNIQIRLTALCWCPFWLTGGHARKAW